MKHLQNLIDSLVNILRSLFIGGSWFLFFYFMWCVTIGLLQAHHIIPGWSVLSVLFSGMSWWGEILTILAIPFVVGVTMGMVLYILYELTFGSKK